MLLHSLHVVLVIIDYKNTSYKILSKMYNKWYIIFKKESFDFTKECILTSRNLLYIYIHVCMHRYISEAYFFSAFIVCTPDNFHLILSLCDPTILVCTTLATYTNLSVKRKMITLKDMMMQKRKMRSFFIRCMFYHRLNCMISKRKTILHYILPTRVYFDITWMAYHNEPGSIS